MGQSAHKTVLVLGICGQQLLLTAGRREPQEGQPVIGCNWLCAGRQ